MLGIDKRGNEPGAECQQRDGRDDGAADRVGRIERRIVGTTRMCAAIFPMVCPHAAVNAPKYDNFSSSRNASIGTGGSAASHPS